MAEKDYKPAEMKYDMGRIRSFARKVLEFVKSPRKEIAKLRVLRFLNKHPSEPMPEELAKHIDVIPELRALNVGNIPKEIINDPDFKKWHTRITGRINSLIDARNFAEIQRIAVEERNNLMDAALPGTIKGNQIRGSQVRYLNVLIRAVKEKIKK